MSVSRGSLALIGLLAIACPEADPVGSGPPPATATAAGGQAPIAAGDGATGGPAGGNPPSGAGAAGSSAGAPPTAGTFAASIPSSELTPLYTQDQLADGVSVSGTLVCPDCAGKLLVRVLPPPPEDPGSEEELHLITTKSFPAVGAFDILVPKDRPKVVLQVVDDANSDETPSNGERMGMPKNGAVVVATGGSGIELVVGVFPEMPAVDGLGAPISGAPEGSAGAAVAPGAEPTGAPTGDALPAGTPPAAGGEVPAATPPDAG